MNGSEGSGPLRPSRTAWLVLFRNVALVGLVTTSLWLLLVRLGVLLTDGWQAATTGIDSSGDLGGTFVYWLLITAPVFALGGLLYEATLYLLSRGSDAWEGWRRRVLLAPLILVPAGLTGPGLRFLVAPGFVSPRYWPPVYMDSYSIDLHRGPDDRLVADRCRRKLILGGAPGASCAGSLSGWSPPLR